jgi:hypothetical protein
MVLDGLDLLDFRVTVWGCGWVFRMPLAEVEAMESARATSTRRYSMVRGLFAPRPRFKLIPGTWGGVTQIARRS